MRGSRPSHRNRGPDVDAAALGGNGEGWGGAVCASTKRHRCRRCDVHAMLKAPRTGKRVSVCLRGGVKGGCCVYTLQKRVVRHRSRRRDVDTVTLGGRDAASITGPPWLGVAVRRACAAYSCVSSGRKRCSFAYSVRNCRTRQRCVNRDSAS